MNIQKTSRDLTLNWHFENDCNMHCQFCFAEKCNRTKQIKHTTFLEKCATIFNRINFVGGEPTINSQLPIYVKKAQELGLQTSIVTNGFTAIKKTNSKILFDCIAGMVTVGFSIDSLNKETNLLIGRNVNGETIAFSEAVEFCNKIKSIGLELKINTVINKFNLNEDFSRFIETVQPNRWKVFQVMPTSNNVVNGNFCITEEDFRGFLQRHSQFNNIINPENNELIRGSYIMVNADGYFMETAPYKVNAEQKSLYESGTDIKHELNKMNYDLEKYDLRYRK